MSEAQRITMALRGRWYGRYGLAFCPAHDNARTPALALSEGRDGQLLARCFAGCGFSAILHAVRRCGLGGDFGRIAPDPAARLRRLAEEEADAARRRGQAARCWAEAVAIKGTLAERYLRARGIRCDLPGMLRFHPDCWHKSGRRFPALVAVVENAGAAVAVHRTYLAEPGRKANAHPEKAMLGPVGGGAVRLSDGPGPLVVAEGIETSLSLVDGLAGVAPRVWAALSASGKANLLLPGKPGELAIAPDGEAAGRKAAEVLARRAYALGWLVRIMEPPGERRDWNDAAREAVA